MQVDPSSKTMNAILAHKYGGPEVLQLAQVPVPEPADHEILVKVHSTAVTAAHMAMRSGKPYIGRLFMGLRKPANPIGGTDFAGEVVQVGKAVTKFQRGDAVFGATDTVGGSYAAYLTLAADAMVLPIPEGVTYEAAAAILDGGNTAYAFLVNLLDIQPGQHVLINGASGSIGTAAVQIAKYLGAEVTGVCSTRNVQLVQGLGADHVIDYTQEDFTANGLAYDVIFDTVGKSSFRQTKKSLTSKGRYLTPVLTFSALWSMLTTSFSKGKRLVFSATGLRDIEEKMEDFRLLRKLLAEGHLQVVIDRTYQLPQVVEAHRYVSKGHKRGNVLLVNNWEAPDAVAPTLASAMSNAM